MKGDLTTDPDRRRFLAIAGTAIAAAHLGLYRAVNGHVGADRDVAALGRASSWLNSPALGPSDLAGKVVLVQFWTYTCINWLRTLPYIRAWAQKYREGLVVIGVHTPEFGFEKNIDNVRRGVLQNRIEYPVAVDSDHAIWRAFDNQYWPALYFIDSRGGVREHHFGEGEYERSERTIQRLLTEAGRAGANGAPVTVSGTGAEAAPDWTNLRSPENYLGHARTEKFASPGGARRNRRHAYAAPKRLGLNEWSLAGEWTMGAEATVSGSAGGRVACRFHARDLHLVMGPPRPGTSVRFRVSIDGEPPGPSHGMDVDDAGNGRVVEPRLYQLVRQSQPIRDRQFEIEFLDAGVETFAFTFG